MDSPLTPESLASRILGLCSIAFIEANAAKESRIPREQLGEAAQVHHTVRQYLQEVEKQNPVEEPVHEQDQVSTTDPDSTYPPRAAHRRGWDTTTTIWWTITVV
jgi:hypothetical protein